MRIEQLDGQCGVQIVSGLTPNPETLCKEIHEYIVDTEDDHCGCDQCEGHSEDGQLMGNVMFTDVVGTRTRPTNGERLAAYIKSNKLGKLRVTEAVKNPTNGNMFRVYLWTPNQKFIKNY